VLEHAAHAAHAAHADDDRARYDGSLRGRRPWARARWAL